MDYATGWMDDVIPPRVGKLFKDFKAVHSIVEKKP
jgi:hypothetical protein